MYARGETSPLFYKIAQTKAVTRPEKIESPITCTGTKLLRARAPKLIAVVKNERAMAKASVLFSLFSIR